MSQPFYHLRPNKYVDRCLFINVLERINLRVRLQEHRYIGFGSYLFDDFKLIHDRINIRSMISLEADQSVFKRAKYNAPYKCIEIINQKSTDFISGENWGEQNSIIWLDYVSPSQLGQQFRDVAALSNVLMPHDIVKVTFNANADTLGKIEKQNTPEPKEQGLEERLDKLKSRIGEYLPSDVTCAECAKDKYPVLLLKSLRIMITQCFQKTKYDKRFALPLFSTIYQDSEHRMLTATFIVLDDPNEVNPIKGYLADIPYVTFDWESPAMIKIPELTVREMLEINQLLPDENLEEQLMESFDFVFKKRGEEAKSYISFYKYYPSFQSVNL